MGSRVALSWFVIRTKNVPLHVPRAPILQNVDSGLHWNTALQQILRGNLCTRREFAMGCARQKRCRILVGNEGVC